MKKLASNFTNMLLSLTLISLLSGISLAYVNEITKGPKAEARKQKKIKAIESVLPTITNDPLSEKMSFPVVGEKDSLDFYLGKDGEELKGVAVSTYTNKGYNGLIRLMVGFNTTGAIHDVVVLEQKETPGLGTQMLKKSFTNQYIGKNPGSYQMTVKKDGGEVDAITGATISSRAFNDAIQRAYDQFVKENESFKVGSNE